MPILGARPCPALLVVLAALLLARVTVGKGSALAELAGRIPMAVAELKAVGEDGHYQGEEIFAYLNGGGEVYLAYNMRGCLAREYAGAAGAFTVDLFDMGSAADAFGVFTYDQDGSTVEVGQDGLLRPGWLSFWKGRFFVSITADADDEAAQSAVVTLGQVVAAAIEEEGLPPALLGALPAAGLVPRSVRYLHHPVILRSHVDVGRGDVLGLGADAEAVLARYRRGENEATVLLARYRQAELASAARDRAGSTLLASWPGAAVQPGVRGGWWAVEVVERDLALVCGAGAPELARALVDEILGSGREAR